MKVLIVRVGAMGDVLHALPGVAALRRVRPDWQIDWVVDPRWAPLLLDGEVWDAVRRGPVVNRLHLAPTRMWKAEPLSLKTMRSVTYLRRELRAQCYDLVVDMQGTLRSAVIGRMAGAEAFAGFADPREATAARLYKTALARRGTHVVDQGAALLADASGIELTPGAVELPREAWAEKWAEEEVKSRPLCLLAAGGGWGAKQWPAQKFGELARALREQGFDVAVNAARKEDPVAAKVVEASSGAARMVVCTVSGLIALLRRTDLLVGGDSGPTHMAAALAVPLVALFGPTDPARNGPWGPGACRVMRNAVSTTSYKRVEAVELGLAQIGVSEVLQAATSLRAES